MSTHYQFIVTRTTAIVCTSRAAIRFPRIPVVAERAGGRGGRAAKQGVLGGAAVERPEPNHRTAPTRLRFCKNHT